MTLFNTLRRQWRWELIVARNQRHERWLSWRHRLACVLFRYLFHSRQQLLTGLGVQFQHFQHWNDHSKKPREMRSKLVPCLAGYLIEQSWTQRRKRRLLRQTNGRGASTMLVKPLVLHSQLATSNWELWSRLNEMHLQTIFPGNDIIYFKITVLMHHI